MEAEGNRPTAADYTWAEARSASAAAESIGTRFRELQAKYDLASEKLRCISYFEEWLHQNGDYVAARWVAGDLRSILEAGTLEDLRALRD